MPGAAELICPNFVPLAVVTAGVGIVGGTCKLGSVGVGTGGAGIARITASPTANMTPLLMCDSMIVASEPSLHDTALPAALPESGNGACPTFGRARLYP